MIRLMIGRDLKSLYLPPARRPARPMLALRRAAHRRLSRAGRSACRCAAARSSALPGWSAPAAPSSPGRCSASTAGSAARSGSTARRSTIDSPARRHRPRHLSRARGSQALGSAARRPDLARISPCRILAMLRAWPARAPRRETANAERQRGSLGIRAPVGRRPPPEPVRRQPAEGRAGEMAVDAAAGADLRRADPRHRRRRQERDLRS